MSDEDAAQEALLWDEAAGNGDGSTVARQPDEEGALSTQGFW
jgi:hypothetical protein